MSSPTPPSSPTSPSQSQPAHLKPTSKSGSRRASREDITEYMRDGTVRRGSSPHRSSEDPLNLDQNVVAAALKAHQACLSSGGVSSSAVRPPRQSAPSMLLRVTSVDGSQTSVDPDASAGSESLPRRVYKTTRSSFSGTSGLKKDQAEGTRPRTRSFNKSGREYVEVMRLPSPEQRTLLTITDKYLRQFTEAILKFANLEYLTITGCEFLSDLSFIDKLGKLKSLTINGTNITEIPIAIMKMPKLEILNVKGNPNLKALPTPPSVQKGINKGEPSFPCGPNLKTIVFDEGITVPVNYTKWGVPELCNL